MTRADRDALECLQVIAVERRRQLKEQLAALKAHRRQTREVLRRAAEARRESAQLACEVVRQRRFVLSRESAVLDGACFSASPPDYAARSLMLLLSFLPLLNWLLFGRPLR